MPLRDLFQRRRSPLPSTVSEELDAELRSPIAWMYPWQLTSDLVTPVAAPELPSVHATRAAMIEPVVREALAAAGPDATVLDLGCNEGWFAQRALEWGAGKAVGYDIRDINVRRARLLRDHYGIPAERLQAEQADVHALDPAALGTFDVVLVLGLIYHLENPIGALRLARALTRGTVVVESQLTSLNEPIRVGWGETDVFKSAEGHWAAILEPAEEQEADGNLLSSFGGLISLVPNAAALQEALNVVGFRDVRMLDAPDDANPQYVQRHRGIAVARV